MARPRFQQHPIASRIWGTICNAMLNCVNVDSAPKRLVQPLPLSTFHNLIYREVWRFWMLAMKQRSGDPNFIRDLKFRSILNFGGADRSPRRRSTEFKSLPTATGAQRRKLLRLRLTPANTPSTGVFIANFDPQSGAL